MIEITYLDASKNERTITFDSYEDFDRSQQACLIGVADYYPVQKLTYNGHDWTTMELTEISSSISRNKI